MHTICCSRFTPDCVIHNERDNNPTIFYNFVGNFIPPEWSNLHLIMAKLKQDCKTATISYSLPLANLS
ncbi:hypothetical protein RHORCCE3_2363 [Rickettsia hoogstraalii str. RCCE3]|nr:hypothetical protein RHORCCE3_2363 [Rickettsia hoogstraalii str. RCCE3]